MTTDADTVAAEGWRRHWYPLAIGQDLGRDEVVAVSIHDHAFAFFRDADGRPRCVVDRCPHRAARLSDGAVCDGRLECLYHGWRFAGDGECVDIPQLPESQPIPAKASVQAFVTEEVQGLIWVWAGPPEDADAEAIPTVPALDAADCTSIDFAIDLPYEQTFLVENVIDIAHIHVAHDGVRGGGHRDLASAIHFDIGERSAAGFKGTFRSDLAGQDGPDLKGAGLEFRAPNLVHYRSLYEDSELVSGLALYSLPLGARRCRLIYRAYSNFWPLRARLRPRFVEHWTQCTILEQDMDVVVGQAAGIVESGAAPSELWLPLKSSDGFVLAYRRWLDAFAADWPYAVGFRRVRAAPERPPEAFDRYRSHTRHCVSCSRADDVAGRLHTVLGFLVVVFLAAAAASATPALAWTSAGLA
ncbi:MAG: Rieske 2Fe-2S domain-containing protein, partial [Acidobacteriota bacterium]